MKKIISILAVSVMSFFISQASFAKDLTYKLGVGWGQEYATWVDKDKNTHPQGFNGLEISYGIARDLQLGGYFGFVQNFHFCMFGPKLRFDFQRLINRDSALWDYLNLYSEVAFFAKLGNQSKNGVVFHAPYLGIEVLPLQNRNLALTMAAGLVVDLAGKNSITLTQNTLGADIGIKYYF